MSQINILLFVTTGFLAGCTTVPAPNLNATHPASPDGQEGARPAAHSSLGADDLTKKIRVQLAAAADAQKEWDEHGPVSGSPPDAGTPDKMKDMPGMDHSKMKGMDHDGQ